MKHNKFILHIFVLILMFFNVSASFAVEELSFAQISDVHYSIDNPDMDRYLYFLSMSLRKKSPDFAVFLGDNVNKSREDDVIGFMRAIHSIRTPYYIVFGDNDAHKIRGIEKKDYLDIVSAFNRNQKEDKNYYYFKPNSDFVCVVLDATSNFAPSKHGEISDEQVEWLEQLLIKYPKRMFIIFHHCPIIPPREEYPLSMINKENYENLLRRHSNIIIVSSGHYHQEAVFQDKNGIRHISAPAFKDIPHAYQLIKIIYDKNTSKSPDDIEITINNIKV